MRGVRAQKRPEPTAVRAAGPVMEAQGKLLVASRLLLTSNCHFLGCLVAGLEDLIAYDDDLRIRRLGLDDPAIRRRAFADNPEVGESRSCNEASHSNGENDLY
jgi:hypothetical protein